MSIRDKIHKFFSNDEPKDGAVMPMDDPDPDMKVGYVNGITDGDTLTIDSNIIRLAIVDTPEYNEIGGERAYKFVKRVCPITSIVAYKIDKNQPKDQFGRTVAKVWTEPFAERASLNEMLLLYKLARIMYRYKNISAFGHEPWCNR